MAWFLSFLSVVDYIIERGALGSDELQSVNPPPSDCEHVLLAPEECRSSGINERGLYRRSADRNS